MHAALSCTTLACPLGVVPRPLDAAAAATAAAAGKTLIFVEIVKRLKLKTLIVTNREVGR